MESILLLVYDVLLVVNVAVATWASKVELGDEQPVRQELGRSVTLVVDDGDATSHARLDVRGSNHRVKPA